MIQSEYLKCCISFQDPNSVFMKDLPPSPMQIEELWTFKGFLEMLIAENVDETVLLGDNVYFTSQGEFRKQTIPIQSTHKVCARIRLF